MIFKTALIWVRPMIPSWRFFGKIDHVVRLRYRFGVSQSQLSAWQTPAPACPLTGWNLFLNAERNFYLARSGLIDQFIEKFVSSRETWSTTDILASSQYRWLYRSALAYAKTDANFNSTDVFQFCIEVQSLTENHPSDLPPETCVFESPLERARS